MSPEGDPIPVTMDLTCTEGATGLLQHVCQVYAGLKEDRLWFLFYIDIYFSWGLSLYAAYL